MGQQSDKHVSQCLAPGPRAVQQKLGRVAEGRHIRRLHALANYRILRDTTYRIEVNKQSIEAVARSCPRSRFVFETRSINPAWSC